MNLHKKIIIADDDPDDRNLASIAFKELNMMHSVDFVTDGQELIDSLKNKINLSHSLPDVILLDLNMPRKDGRLALKEIKANPELCHLNIVVFSTSSAKEDIDYTMSLGAKNYIIKPSGYIELVNILRSVCEEFVVDSTLKK
ncbi:MAG: response regulator [Bacteroidia bacterium]|jgi:CheY-like chemotaxis protein